MSRDGIYEVEFGTVLKPIDSSYRIRLAYVGKYIGKIGSKHDDALFNAVVIVTDDCVNAPVGYMYLGTDKLWEVDYAWPTER